VALEKRLYEEEFSTDLPPDAVKATVPGASNSHTITAKGTQDGVTYTTGVTSFADGPFLYVVFAGRGRRRCRPAGRPERRGDVAGRGPGSSRGLTRTVVR
jgi:hypothetical protein